MTDRAELKRLAEAARSTNKQSGYDALARACTASTILSLVQRVEEAEGLVDLALQNTAEIARRASEVRRDTLEEVAKLLDQAEASAMLNYGVSLADVQKALSDAAQAIRALKEKA